MLACSSLESFSMRWLVKMTQETTSYVSWYQNYYEPPWKFLEVLLIC